MRSSARSWHGPRRTPAAPRPRPPRASRACAGRTRNAGGGARRAPRRRCRRPAQARHEPRVAALAQHGQGSDEAEAGRVAASIDGFILIQTSAWLKLVGFPGPFDAESWPIRNRETPGQGPGMKKIMPAGLRGIAALPPGATAAPSNATTNADSSVGPSGPRRARRSGPCTAPTPTARTPSASASRSAPGGRPSGRPRRPTPARRATPSAPADATAFARSTARARRPQRLREVRLQKARENKQEADAKDAEQIKERKNAARECGTERRRTRRRSPEVRHERQQAQRLWQVRLAEGLGLSE